MSNLDNPYRPPEFVDEVGSSTTPAEANNKLMRLALWTIVFSLNLIVPIYFGWGDMGDQARIGMLLVCAATYAVGCKFCFSHPSIVSRFLGGAILLALTQFIPIIHVIALFLGISLADLLAFFGGWRKLESLGSGILVTTVVALVLCYN